MAFLRGVCPDASCGALLFFPGYEASVECGSCGQRHCRAALRRVEAVPDVRAAAALTARRLLAAGRGGARGPENVKVLGSSNYHCKLLSPLLSTHGLEKSTGRARLLLELTGQPQFQCSVLAAYAFRLDPQHLETAGYGRDQSGSALYLRDTLQAIQQSNDGEERLVPVHADGDGHCLVHALSRALTGRELFWHPLRLDMQRHLTENLPQYQELFGEFVDADEWPAILAECDPDYTPPDGQPHGLRNLHVFALANVLRRPLLLLDSLSGLRSSGDYAALFLPALVPPAECRAGGGAGVPNSPLCLAWSSAARNHYIALVPVRDRELPRLPVSLLPKVWGVEQTLRDLYVTVSDGACVIGSEKSLQDGYIQRLTAAMDDLFVTKHSVHPELVADAHLHLFKRIGVFGYSPPYVCDEVKDALREDRLFRCLRCHAVLEQRMDSNWLLTGGYMHQLASKQHGKLNAGRFYRFPQQGVICSYDAEDDCLKVTEDFGIKQCSWCEGTVRHVLSSGVPRYQNGDVTRTPAAAGARCGCGLKHYWDGAEYDSPPTVFPVTLRWGNKVVSEKVTWFEGESDASLNSNVYETANRLVAQHFPGVFGIEVLVKKVVDQILEQTKPLEEATPEASEPESEEPKPAAHASGETASKIIVTGINTLHKEELGVSETERRLKARIERNAPLQQRRSTPAASPPSAAATVATSSTPAPPAASASAAAAGDSGAAAKRPQPAGCRVRVVASDGRQAELNLQPAATYGCFLQAVVAQLRIERTSIRRVLHGFPPRQVVLADADPAPFQSGDRVQVELAREPAPESGPPAAPAPVAAAASAAPPEEEEEPLPAAELEAGVQALVLASRLAGTDLWTQVQSMPRLFGRGGLFYQLARRDVGLTDGQSVRLQALPGKMFRYSRTADALLLSLEPFGHHAVSPGVEQRVLSSAAIATAAQLPRQVSSGGARVSTGLHVQQRPTPASFSGAGRTLGGAASADQAATFVRTGPGSVVLRPQGGSTVVPPDDDPQPPSEPANQTMDQS